jgi:propanol-preferring alcohol dehydrogenase
VVLNAYTLRGSIVGTRKDLEEALAFAAEGKVKASIELLPLESINDVLSRLKRGKVNGRIVLKGEGTQSFSQFLHEFPARKENTQLR